MQPEQSDDYETVRRAHEDYLNKLTRLCFFNDKVRSCVYGEGSILLRGAFVFMLFLNLLVIYPHLQH
jgi:hypothetical protein